jgi:hypothetical protein
MHEIFISYRREDSYDATGRIHDWLDYHFGPDAIFRDIDSIRGGTQFPKLLGQAIELCKVVLVVIGPRWATVSGDDVKPRIFSETDWTRKEVERALASDKEIIPVLVTFAGMPHLADVPPELHGLLGRNAIEVQPSSHFRIGATELVRQISKLTGLQADSYVTAFNEFRKLGLVSAFVGLLSRDSLVEETVRTARNVLMVMNDGRGFVDSMQELIQERASDPEKTTRLVFLHPKSEYINLLIQKNKKTRAAQIHDIERSYRALATAPDSKSSIEVRGSHGMLTSSYLVSERYAFVSPYLSAERGSLPVFRFAEVAGNMHGLYSVVSDDAQAIFKAAKPLMELDFL